MQVGWQRESERKDVAEDKYIRLEAKIAKTLYTKLPNDPAYRFDDVLAHFRLYALEAVDLYNPDTKAKFSTFLYRHLSIRAFQWKNWAWLAKQKPKDKSVNNFSAYVQSSEEEGVFDPTRHAERAGTKLEISELLTGLSSDSRAMLNMILNITDNELITAFKHPHYKSRVSSLTGFTQDQVEGFVVEMRSKAPTYITGIG